MYRLTIGTDRPRMFKTLFRTMRAARNTFVEDAKHGLFRELTVEARWDRNSPWYALPAEDIEKAAAELRLANWKPGRGTVTAIE